MLRPHSIKYESIEQFSLGKTIGQGTFGKVKEAVHLQSQQKVAIKILEKKKIKERKDLERIQRELLILKKIDHPNIIKLLNVIETKERILIVTELIEGEQLYSMIVSKGRLSVQEAQEYFSQLFSAIQFLHSKGICHRDVKPENIMVRGSRLKLLDFGLSSQFTEECFSLSTPCGSPCYAAPQMLAKGRYDCRKVDIWAMGVTLFAMIEGKLPYEHDKTDKLYKIIEKRPLQPITGLPDEVNELLTTMICKNPEKRATLEQIRMNKWLKESMPTASTNFFYNDTNSCEYLIEEKRIVKKKSSVCQKQLHCGPFHINFVFNGIEKLKAALENSGKTYFLNTNDDYSEISVEIDGQIHAVKHLENCPKLLYLPIDLSRSS